MYRRNSNNKNVSDMYCKICKDSGMSKAIFEGHNIKTPTGIICCPILKEHQCGTCGKRGHFASYCQMKEKHKEPFSNNKLLVNTKTLVQKSKNNSTNQYSDLYVDDVDEDDDITKPLLIATTSVSSFTGITAKCDVLNEKKCNTKIMKSWADSYSDSDSDDEDEDIHPNVTLRDHQQKWRK